MSSLSFAAVSLSCSMRGALASTVLLATCGLHAGTVASLDKAVQPGTAPSTELQDLSIGNFFSAGWDEPWAKHPHPNGAPDMSLLRVQNNFLERELRLDYLYQNNPSDAKVGDLNFASALVAWGFNRRLMLGVIGSEQWNDSRTGEDKSGTSGAVLARWQLIDNVNSSYALNTRVTIPNHGIGETITTISAGPAGWEDLTRFGLNRVGLYWHVQEEGYVGPAAAGTRRNALTYDLSLAKTWTGPTDPIGNFSTFVEAFARTDLDGDHSGRTVPTLTPGIRMTFDHGKHVLMAGMDIPVGGYRSIDTAVRFTYVLNF